MVCISAKNTTSILVLTAILTSLIGTFTGDSRQSNIAVDLFSRAVLGYRLRICRRLLYDSAFGLIAQYGTLPVVGWSMSFGGLILLPFYAKEGTHFAVSGSLILAFFYRW